jgi:hypothetical protein
MQECDYKLVRGYCYIQCHVDYYVAHIHSRAPDAIHTHVLHAYSLPLILILTSSQLNKKQNDAKCRKDQSNLKLLY